VTFSRIAILCASLAACRGGAGFTDVEQAALARALEALRQGDYEQAERLTAGLAKDHPSAHLLGIVGIAQLRQGDAKKAAATLERAQKLDPASAELAMARAFAWLAADKPDKAKDAARLAQSTLVDETPYSRALALGGLDRKGTAEALLRIGQELLRGGQSAAALGMFQEAAVLDPKLPTARLLLGSALYNLKAWPRAVAHLRAAIQMGAPASGAWKLIGHSLTQLGDNKGALEAYTQVLRATPGDPDASAAIARLSGRPVPAPPRGPAPGAPAARGAPGPSVTPAR
jgi:tetratricopeptide (TPR) repeat protein